MHIKKASGKVYGASLTAAEKKAMEIELRKQFAEYEREHQQELDAIIIWQLHEQLGFGPKRLKRFYDNFAPAIKKLLDWYVMDENDQSWLCSHKLKEYGIDIQKWNTEKGRGTHDKT